MNQAAATVFNTALIMIEGSILLILANGFFNRKQTNHFVRLSFVITVLVSCVFLLFVSEISFLKVAFISGLFSIWLIISYETSCLKAVFSVLFWQAYLLIGDNGLMMMIGAMMGKSLPELTINPDTYYFLCISIKIAELLGTVVFQIWLKQHFTRVSISFSEGLRVLILPISAFVISIFLLRIYYFSPESSWELIICNTILLFVDVVSVFLFNYLEQQHKAISDNIILRQSMKTQLDNVEAWRKAYEGQRKQTHDFQNQLLVIHGLVERQAPKSEILGYIERLQHIDSNSTMIVHTHRTAVDIILNQKYAIAESKMIRFVTQLDDLSSFPLQDDALIVVLSNLIDNAIEACEKIEDSRKRFILLKMKVEPQASFLRIENATALPVIIHNNRIVSTKKNPAEHGFGLQNVVAVLDQRNAIYLINYDISSGIFSFSIQIADE